MKIEISVKTVLFTFAVLAGLWLVGQILDILFLLFISFLLMTAILPMVVFLEKLKIPRALGVLIIYSFMFGLIGASIAGSIPTLMNQSGRLIEQLPSFVAQVLPYWNIDISSFSQQVAPIGESLVKVTLGVFSNFFAVLTVLVITFYFLMERRNADEILTSVFGHEIAVRSLKVLRAVERRLGGWVRGELLLMSAVGVCSYIGLVVLHVDFALPLALLAGLFEILPTIGPMLSAVPAILVALSVSPFLALSVVALYILVQQLENNFLVPAIMKKSIGFPPIVTILVLLVGGRLGGFVGAMLSIPIALVVQEVISEVLNQPFGTQNKPTKNSSQV